MAARKSKGTYRLYLRRNGRRGRCIWSGDRYALLVDEAKHRARRAGFPASAWMELFDWSLD